MTGRAAHRLSALLIVSVAFGCDNVEWGGAQVRLQEPPPAVIGAAPDTVVAAAAVRVDEVPEGPVLFMAVRDTGGLRVIPVGGILEDSIAAFHSEAESSGYRARFVRAHLAPGTELVLFASGVRVGSFTVGSIVTDESFCVPRPAALGVTELIPEAMGQTRFLALPRAYAASREWSPLVITEMEREQRDATLTLPNEVLTRVGAQIPPNILDTRWHMQAFRPGNEGPVLFTATYLIRDRLLVERPPPTAYSLFLMAAPGRSGYEPVFSWYRHVAAHGKGAPLFFEQMDWDGDGQAEVLLEVLGESKRWFATVEQEGGSWSLAFEDPCGAAAPPIGASD